MVVMFVTVFVGLIYLGKLSGSWDPHPLILIRRSLRAVAAPRLWGYVAPRVWPTILQAGSLSKNSQEHFGDVGC